MRANRLAVDGVNVCLATVGKVVGMKKGKGSIIVAYGGKRIELNSKLVKVKIGDYVHFAGGIALEKTSKEEAETNNRDVKW
jgi:hydrogenase maturation factor